MSGMWNRTLIYLGLREEPEEIHDELPARFAADDRSVHEPGSPAARERELAGVGAHRDGEADRHGGGAADEAMSRSLGNGEIHLHPTAATSSASARAALVEVAVFEDVEAVGARYRTGQPVLFDVSGADRATARRIVDFVSGLTYGLRGELTKVAARAFLLVPEGLELSADERRRLSELGYRLPDGSSS